MEPWEQWITAKKLMARWGFDVDKLAQAIYTGELTFVVRLPSGEYLCDGNEFTDLYRDYNYPRLAKLLEHGILNPLVVNATAVFPVEGVIAFEKKHGIQLNRKLPRKVILNGREVYTDSPEYQQFEERTRELSRKHPPPRETVKPKTIFTAKEIKPISSLAASENYKIFPQQQLSYIEEEKLLPHERIPGDSRSRLNFPSMPPSDAPDPTVPRYRCLQKYERDRLTVDKLENVYYPEHQVLRLWGEQPHHEVIDDKQDQGPDRVATEAQNQEPDSRKQDSEASLDDYALCKKGQFWELKFKGKTYNLKDTKGIQYIAKILLLEPGRECQVTDLEPQDCVRPAKDMDTLEIMDDMTYEQLEEEGFSVKKGNYNRPDYEAIRNCRNTMQIAHDKIIKAKREGDLEEIKRAEKAFEEGKIFLLDEYGFQTKVKNKLVYLNCWQKSDIKKLKDAVFAAIRRALENIKGLEDDELYKFLKDSIHMSGATCSYYTKGGQAPQWTVKL